MSFKITEFISSINKHGVVRTNRFIATFNLPSYLKDDESKYGVADKLISLRCESAQIPGMNLTDTPGVRLGYGSQENMPYSVAFDDISLTFLMDAHTRLHKLFYDWVNTIVNFDKSKGQSGLSSESSKNSNTKGNAFEVGYKNMYKTDIIITVYDTTDESPIMTVKAYNAYPKSMPAADLSWGSPDELMKMTIPFSYTDYDVEYHRSDSIFKL